MALLYLSVMYYVLRLCFVSPCLPMLYINLLVMYHSITKNPRLLTLGSGFELKSYYNLKVISPLNFSLPMNQQKFFWLIVGLLKWERIELRRDFVVFVSQPAERTESSFPLIVAILFPQRRIVVSLLSWETEVFLLRKFFPLLMAAIMFSSIVLILFLRCCVVSIIKYNTLTLDCQDKK